MNERPHHHGEPAHGTTQAKSGAIHTCSIHPDIRQGGPEGCPKCGMALEPRTVADGEGESTECVDRRRRFWFAAALTLPLVILAMGDMLPGRPVSSLVSMHTRVWLALMLATPASLWSAWPLFLCAIARARRLSHKTMVNIEQNLFFAFLHNSAGLSIAAGIPYPFFGLLLNPVVAAAMSFSWGSVVSNSLRLRGMKIGSSWRETRCSKVLTAR